MRTCPGCRRAVNPPDSHERYCEICRNRHRGAAGLAERRHAYYSVLHEDPDFVADLTSLFSCVRPHIDDEGPEEDKALRSFAGRWHIPRAFTSEIAASLYAAKYDFPLRLRAAHGHLTLKKMIIHPKAPNPFHYNPAVHPSTVVKQLSAQFAEDLREQIHRARQEAIAQGWRPLAPRLRSRTSLLLLARRLYRRAVLVWSWARIAAAEGKGVTPHAVRISVSEWAHTLDVVLPKISRGRPRKQK
jgi:hypothetical protein